MLRERLITAIILLTIATICLYVGGILLHLLMLVIYAVGSYEFLRLRSAIGEREALLFTILFTLLPLSFWTCGVSGVALMVPVLAIIFFGWIVLQTEGDEHLGFPLDAIGHLFLGLGYIGLFGTMLFALTSYYPRALLFSFLFTVIAADTGAFFGGRLIGGKKLAPRVSPGKTVSGAICGIFFAILVSLGGRHWLHLAPDWNSKTILFGIASGVLVGVLSILGDLSESLLKRMYDVKDSGTLLPGHGGVLDRIDGILFAAPALVILGGFPL